MQHWLECRTLFGETEASPPLSGCINGVLSLWYFLLTEMLSGRVRPSLSHLLFIMEGYFLCTFPLKPDSDYLLNTGVQVQEAQVRSLQTQYGH
jgi:hypothetical protein